MYFFIILITALVALCLVALVVGFFRHRYYKKKVERGEINEMPGSLSFYLWEATGVSFEQLTDRLIAGALRRKREQSLKTVSYDQNIFSLGGGIKGGIKK